MASNMPSTAITRIAAVKSAAAKRPKAAEIVAAELRRQIVTGRLKPGDKLHPENVLTTEFEISRPTLREALRLLESESLITISRGKHGGARVSSIDLSAASRQVGVFLQLEGATLQDVWLARTLIEPPAAALLATRRDPAAFAALAANIEEARDAADKHELIRYADLSAEFSLLITKHCGSKTIHLMASLIYDIIRRQHEHVTERTSTRSSVDKLRQESIESRVKALALMRKGPPAAVERFWRAHLEHMRDLVMAAYKGPVTIDVLNEPAAGKQRPIGAVKRPVRLVA
jgi:DNA-binding FadR family transcriptional regulator